MGLILKDGCVYTRKIKLIDKKTKNGFTRWCQPGHLQKRRHSLLGKCETPEMNGAVFPLLPCVRGFENPLPKFMMIV